ncbi:MAG: desulfoferrodoxin family protein [Lachnospiraceae bacterium]|nr:desulfoferrodoxin family protein [Lachnospiraceae bacterium]
MIELMSGNDVINSNKAFRMDRMKFYVCPVCGNVICSTGEALISCCGITLPPIETEEADAQHEIHMEVVEDEYYVSVRHDMNKEHYVSFIAAVMDNGYEIVKLYPEGPAEARFMINRTRKIYCYCNRHGLFEATPLRRVRK